MAEETKDSKSKVIVIILIIVICLLLAGGTAAALIILNSNNNSAEANNAVSPETTTAAATSEKNPLILDYDDSAVALDAEGLERQIEAMKNADGRFSLEYKNEAFSSDGTHFECYLANSEKNKEDVFIAIFKDVTMNEQLYLSGLVRPGTSIQGFESEIPIDSGTHSVVCMFTSVSDDHETMTSQISVELKLTVNKEQ
jgi:hypothetical protein